MRYLSYTLTIPRNNSWNNKWSGDNQLFCRIRKIREPAVKTSSEYQLAGQSFFYDFGDGWTACIKVKEVTLAEANNLKKNSRGFSSYDWMIASLIKNGEITYDPNWQRPIYF